jgi:hypothetical protein
MAISLDTSNDLGRFSDPRQKAVLGLATGIADLNEVQYERMVDEVMARLPWWNRCLQQAAMRFDQLSESRRDQLFSKLNASAGRQRENALAALTPGFRQLNPEQREEIFEATLRHIATNFSDTYLCHPLEPLCRHLDLLKEDQRARLIEMVATLPSDLAGKYKKELAAALAGRLRISSRLRSIRLSTS